MNRRGFLKLVLKGAAAVAVAPSALASTGARTGFETTVNWGVKLGPHGVLTNDCPWRYRGPTKEFPIQHEALKMVQASHRIWEKTKDVKWFTLREDFEPGYDQTRYRK